MAEFIKSKGLGKEFLGWVEKRRKQQPKAMPGYELSKKEQAKKREEEESSDEEVVDPKIAKRLEEVRKRREAQAKQRIAADGYDRMMPLSADNHPPGTVWPPRGQADPEAEAEAAPAPPKPAAPTPEPFKKAAVPDDDDEGELDLTKKKKKKKPKDVDLS